MLDEKVDAKENSIVNIEPELLNVLLKDHTTQKNIIWATDIYKSHGFGYDFNDEINIYLITGHRGLIIKPRIKKSKSEQQLRIKDKAEVFTPSWICNRQNNLVDLNWIDETTPFNKENSYSWITKNDKIKFKNNIVWTQYVEDNRMEISCGEAPYLVSRYDTTTGKVIDIENRIGLLDRKLRVINENVNEKSEWINWVYVAYKSVYGYDWQGDNVLIARENLFYTFLDYYNYKFNDTPDILIMREIAEIISWNVWQMDGIKLVIPNSCTNERTIDYTLFGENLIINECNGCKKNNISTHNGIYAKIMNWETGRAIKFITVLKRSEKL